MPQQPSVDEALGHSLHLNWEVTPNMELRSITAYREVSADQWDNAGSANRPPVFAPNGNFSRYSLSYLEQLQRSQEFQLVGSFDSVDYILGLFYFNEKAWEEAATPSTNRWNADGTGYTINDPTPTIPGRRSLDRASVAYAESTGIYGQLDLDAAGPRRSPAPDRRRPPDQGREERPALPRQQRGDQPDLRPERRALRSGRRRRLRHLPGLQRLRPLLDRLSRRRRLVALADL